MKNTVKNHKKRKLAELESDLSVLKVLERYHPEEVKVEEIEKETGKNLGKIESILHKYDLFLHTH